MNLQELKNLVSKMLALVLSTALAIGMLPAAAMARTNPYDYSVKSVECTDKDDEGAYTF